MCSSLFVFELIKNLLSLKNFACTLLTLVCKYLFIVASTHCACDKNKSRVNKCQSEAIWTQFNT